MQHDDANARMIRDQIRSRGVRDERVLDVLASIPREVFVPQNLRASAYDDTPLPLTRGQTISQPYIVACMTEMLRLRGDEKVLEIGTGSGYQTAILAELAKEVVTIEVVAELAADARARLEAQGYRNVTFAVGDGAAGRPEQAPFDAIVVTAAAPAIPPALIEQLAPRGRLVIPRGGGPLSQELVLVEKDAAGESHERTLFPVAFVPLTGGGAC